MPYPFLHPSIHPSAAENTVTSKHFKSFKTFEKQICVCEVQNKERRSKKYSIFIYRVVKQSSVNSNLMSGVSLRTILYNAQFYIYHGKDGNHRIGVQKLPY